MPNKTKISMEYPDNVLKYSSLKYLQWKVSEICKALPQHFATLEEWKTYKSNLVPKLKELLPVWEPTQEFPDINKAKIDLGEDLILEAVDVNVEYKYFVPIHIYRPKNINRQLPVVLVCPGYAQPKNAQDVADICIAFAKAGIMAAAVEYDGTGECADRPDAVTGINNVTALALLIGMNNVGLRVMHNLSVLRYLKSRNDVNSECIGITGLCQGSIILWYTAALCEDFKAIAPICGTTTLEAEALEYTNRQGGWTGTSPFVFDILKHCDVQHLYGCFAPRPLLVQNNIVDHHWPYSGLQKVKDMIENIYGLYNANGNCSFLLEHEPHAFVGNFIKNTVEWFSNIFLNNYCMNNVKVSESR
ncbi:MAG: dienelactone hydrolase family protein [Firmicutes bacterium]|nr:dienelactone hydrolase family protein [Bacillota bacterium]